MVISNVEADLDYCADAFGYPVVVCDPWQMQSTIQRLGGRMRIKEFTFTLENLRRLSEVLYTLIAGTKLRLYHDAELEREILALDAKQTSYGWRIDHKVGGYSDRAMALGMACVAALENTGGTPQIRWLGVPSQTVIEGGSYAEQERSGLRRWLNSG